MQTLTPLTLSELVGTEKPDQFDTLCQQVQDTKRSPERQQRADKLNHNLKRMESQNKARRLWSAMANDIMLDIDDKCAYLVWSEGYHRTMELLLEAIRSKYGSPLGKYVWDRCWDIGERWFSHPYQNIRRYKKEQRRMQWEKKEQCWKLGRKLGNAKKTIQSQNKKLDAIQLRSQGYKTGAIAKELGLSIRQIRRYLNG